MKLRDEARKWFTWTLRNHGLRRRRGLTWKPRSSNADTRNELRIGEFHGICDRCCGGVIVGIIIHGAITICVAGDFDAIRRDWRGLIRRGSGSRRDNWT